LPAGQYAVQATATDLDGATATAERTLQVLAPAPLAPAAPPTQQAAVPAEVGAPAAVPPRQPAAPSATPVHATPAAGSVAQTLPAGDSPTVPAKAVPQMAAAARATPSLGVPVALALLAVAGLLRRTRA
jgi:hypothetical protein